MKISSQPSQSHLACKASFSLPHLLSSPIYLCLIRTKVVWETVCQHGEDPNAEEEMEVKLSCTTSILPRQWVYGLELWNEVETV